MTIDVYSHTGTKTGTMALPDVLFGSYVNQDLMHQAVVMQQSNRRNAIAHVKSRGEVAGTTKKQYAQKHTGRARRGSGRSPLLRGGGKAFGPRNDANFIKNMPKNMRHAALVSCLSAQAKRGVIMALESYPDTVKTKPFFTLLNKLPVPIGRRILFVVPEKHHALWMSSRNVPRIKILPAAYLNPEDVLLAWSIIFVGDAIEKAEAIFGKGSVGSRVKEEAPVAPKAPKKVKAAKVEKETKKKTGAKKTAAKASKSASAKS